MIKIKAKYDLEALRQSGKILASIIRELKSFLTIGMTTQEIDGKVDRLISDRGARAAFKGYRGFPCATCISVNEEVVHGIPGPRVIHPGDVVSIDVGIIHKEFYTDTAFTIGFEPLSQQKKQLIAVTEQALFQGIRQAVVGNHLSDISFAIQTFVEAHHFSVVRDFVGHGIGRQLHEEPEIPNYGPAHQGPILKEGMVFAIEPMVNLGSWETKILNDGWTVVTRDGASSAHFEHTVIVSHNGPEIITQ